MLAFFTSLILQERSKLKAIAMKEKLEREAASKKPTEFASNTM